MGGVLLALKRLAVDLAARHHLGGDRFDGAVAQGGGGLGRIIEEGNQLGRGRRPACRNGFGDSQNMAPGMVFSGFGHTEACSASGVQT